ncbi:uncharacterized protein LOC134819761 isoform X3 [Bolinopsis microptera]|uniref:uncharacterized protein LOC134819761 isoform X3 n=1 Tax=Bolinopsis microptera TaxID=2820187 RepID=UPI00307A60A4
MVKFLILVLSLVVLGQCCNYAKLEKIDRLMEQFLNLVEEKKYKYEAALMTYELMNYNEVEEDNPEDYAVAGELRDGLLGAGSQKCDHAIWARDSDTTVMACQPKRHLNGLTFVPSPYGGGQFTEAVCCVAK